jgi:hypothetical protein
MIDDASGIHAMSVSSPNLWHGEIGCVVGPFSSLDVAQTYLSMVQFCEFDCVLEQVFAKDDAWYVTVEALQ